MLLRFCNNVWLITVAMGQHYSPGTQSIEAQNDQRGSSKHMQITIVKYRFKGCFILDLTWETLFVILLDLTWETLFVILAKCFSLNYSGIQIELSLLKVMWLILYILK